MSKLKEEKDEIIQLKKKINEVEKEILVEERRQSASTKHLLDLQHKRTSLYKERTKLIKGM